MKQRLFLLAFICSTASLQAELPRAKPESQGVSSTGVLRFVERADAEIDAMNSFMLVRHGHVVAEGWWAPYQPDDRHQLYSLSKSFTSVALGIAIGKGKLSLDDRVTDWFPDRLPAEPSNHLRWMRVRDLLRMTTGHRSTDLAGFRWGPEATVERFLSLPVTLKPGTHFTYNTPATYMASAVLQQATGETTHEYLKPRLLEPLGITDTWWEATPEGVTMGGSGLSVRTEAIATFGQLLLQRGEWQGEQLVPAEWIDAATAMQTPTGSDPSGDWDQGYGYQFWQSTHGYRGDGAFGQFCLVLPEHHAVVAITSGVRDMGAVMRLVWEELLPALHDEPLPADAESVSDLRAKLANLEVPTPEGAATSPLAKEIANTIFHIADDPLGLRAIRLERTEEGAQLTITNATGEHPIAIGHNTWHRNRVASIEGLAKPTNSLAPPPEDTHALAASGAWTTGSTYAARLCLNETPFYLDVTLRFTEGGVTIDVTQNAMFGNQRVQSTRQARR